MNHPLAASRSKPLVLVVDDRPASLQFLCSAIADYFDVVVATSAEQALELCRREPPDLVLMDVVMPGLGGLEGCQRLHAEPGMADTPVIFVTASTCPEDELACWDAGGVDFIGKPASPVTIRNRVAVHLRLKRMADQLRRISLTDELTGIANRRAFEQAFDAAWSECRASNAPMSLLLSDVDWFKAYNDHYGHAAGDEALKVVARELRNALRGMDDVVARIGGEEFAVLLPRADVAAARVVSTRAMAALQALGLPHAAAPGGVLSVSIGGITSLPSGAATMRWYLQRADEQLYAAKAAGRTRYLGVQETAA